MEAEVTPAGTRQEWEAGKEMLSRTSNRPGKTVGADKGYDTADFVESCRAMVITPHVAAKESGSQLGPARWVNLAQYRGDSGLHVVYDEKKIA